MARLVAVVGGEVYDPDAAPLDDLLDDIAELAQLAEYSPPGVSEAWAEADPTGDEAVARARALEQEVYDLTSEEVKTLYRLLTAARSDTVDALAGATKEWYAKDRQAVLTSLDRSIAKFDEAAGRSLTTVQSAGWEKGAGTPETVGIVLSSLPTIDQTVLNVAVATTPDLITNVSRETKAKIATMLRMAALGQKSPLDLIKQMGAVSGKGVWATAFARGEAIYRTEAGRMFSSSTFLRQRQLEEQTPGWEKEWHSVHDSRTRRDHVIADGQRVGVNEFYTIGGWKALYPHDPGLPARQSVHCRCVSITVRPEWLKAERSGPSGNAIADRVAADVRESVARAVNERKSLLTRMKSALDAGLEGPAASQAIKKLEAEVDALSEQVAEVETLLLAAEVGTDDYYILQSEREALTDAIGQIKALVGGLKVASLASKRVGEAEALAEYNPYRDRRGRFASRGAAGALSVGPEVALADLAAGRKPSVDPGDVGAVMVAAAGRKDDPDLTELKVHGTMKFGDDGLGVARRDMPQLPEGAQREAYFASLKRRGVRVEQERVSPQSLKPTQKEVSARKAGEIYVAMKDGSFRDSNRLTVSSDNFVLDGHHRWGAATALSFEKPGMKIGIDRVDMPIVTLLNDAGGWTAEQGIAPKEFGSEAVLAEHLPGKHDQRTHGKGGGGGIGPDDMPSPQDPHGIRASGLNPAIYPNVTSVDMSSMEPRTAREVIDHMNALGNTYPAAASRLTKLRSSDAPPDGMPPEAWASRTWAATNQGSGEMVFNSNSMKTLDDRIAFEQQHAYMASFGASMVRTYPDVATHEFGHLVFANTLAELGERLPKVSGYGASSGAENLAEVFVARMTNSPKLPPPGVRLVDELIASTETLGSMRILDVSESLIEHLPGKHDQRTHGRGGAIAGFPNAQVDISLADAEGQRIITSTLAGLAAAYPSSATEVQFIRLVASAHLSDGTAAQYNRGTNELRLNDEVFGSASKRARWREASRSFEDSGFIYDASPKGTLTHEFGHVIADRATFGWAQHMAGITANTTYGGANVGERFAELFAAYTIPRPGKGLIPGTPEHAAVEKVIARAEEGVSESLAEHLPGKHNQATHGRGGTAGFLARDIEANGGGSYMAKGLAPITTGAVVARKAHSAAFDAERFKRDPAYRKQAVSAYFRDNRAEFAKGGQLGTWDTTGEGGKTIVFDVIDNVSRRKAIKLGRERGEDGIFDLDRKEYVPTGGTTYTGGG